MSLKSKFILILLIFFILYGVADFVVDQFIILYPLRRSGFCC